MSRNNVQRARTALWLSLEPWALVGTLEHVRERYQPKTLSIERLSSIVIIINEQQHSSSLFVQSTISSTRTQPWHRLTKRCELAFARRDLPQRPSRARPGRRPIVG